MRARKICWKPIPDANGEYWISRDGTVLSLRRLKLIEPRLDKFGRKRVFLRINESRQNKEVARLVMEIFNSPAPSELWFVHHKDNNLNNCAADNLRWKSRSETTTQYYKYHLNIAKGWRSPKRFDKALFNQALGIRMPL